MTQFEYDQFRGVRLDRCKGCGGIWLDHGEAETIADRLEGKAPEAAAEAAPQAAPQVAPIAPAAVAAIAPPAPAPQESSGLELAEIPREAGTTLEQVAPPGQATGTDGGFDPHRVLAARGEFDSPRPLLTRQHLIGWGIPALVVLALYLVLRQSLVDVGDDASRLSLTTQLSGTRNFGLLRGKVVFLRFFDGNAPPFSCPNTRLAAQNERALRERYAGQPQVSMLSVHIGEQPPKAAPVDGWEGAHYAKEDLYHRFFEKDSGLFGTAYSFPAYVIVGKDGRVVYKGQGNKPLEFFVGLVDEALSAP
jgi:hypothetical protein